MTADEIRAIAVDALSAIAPEADFATLGDDEPLREVLDLDSMDFLNFIATLHRATGAEIPEAHYARLQTMGGVIAYLAGTPPV